MSCKNKFTLIKALEMSIERISNNFNGNWLITGNRDKDGIYGCRDKKNSGRYNESCPQVYHSYIEMCVCVSGAFAIELMNDIYEIKEGEACIIFPGIMHNELSEIKADYLAIWIVLNLNRIRIHLSGNVRQKFSTADLRTFIPDYAYNNITNNINLEKKHENGFSNLTFKLYILHVLIITLKKISMEGAEQEEKNTFKKNIVEEVEGFIEMYGLRHLRLRDISQELFISEGYLNSIFKSVTGFTIMQYIEHRRIEKAKYLLVSTRESINDISKQLGYYDQYHFSKSFKKAAKFTPTQYRKASLP